MKFGMLQVTAAGGAEREVPIDLPSLLVGRSDDNGVVLDDISVSRRHARLVVESGNLLVEDLGSANGTFIDGQRIPPHSPNLVEPNQAIRFGNVETRYSPPPVAGVQSENGGTQPAPGATSVPSVLSSASSFTPMPGGPSADPAPSTLRLSVTTSATEVAAGDVLYATATVQNHGRIVEQVSLEIADLAPEWVTVGARTFALLPGEKEDVTIVVRPPRSPGATAGLHTLTVLATASQRGEQSAASASFSILPFEEVVAALAPAQAARDFRLEIRNDGNAPGRFTLEGSDDEEVLRFEVGPGHTALGPGESVVLPVSAKPDKRPLTGPQQVTPFKVRLTTEGSGAQQEFAARLAVSSRIGSGRRLLAGIGALVAVIAAIVAIFLFQGGGGDGKGVVAAPTSGKAAEGDVHLCAPGESGPPAPPSVGFVREKPAGLASLSAKGLDPTAPLFAQNDSRWAGSEYAKASDDQFRSQNTCGSTIAQCGCAMTSIATVMSLFQVATMPDGQALTPEQLNNWLNIGAKRTGRGWVSQGYIYGDVIWAAANQLSAEIARAHPGTPTVRFRGIGSGSEAQVRAELQAGRPIILEVPGHWIAAIGIDPANNKILINDPFYADRKTLDVYAGKVRSSVLFEPSANLAALVITVPSDLRVRLIDPQGHVVGTFDRGTPAEAGSKAIRDIPGASYVFKPAWRDPNCINRPPGPDDGTNQIIITGPAAGRYRIEVVNPAGGSTSVAVHLYDEDGNLSMRTEEKNSDQRLDIDVGGPTPTATANGSSTATKPATGTRAPTTAVTPVPSSTATTATSPTSTIKPTPGPQPPTTSATCTYEMTGGPYSGTVGSADVTFKCQGTYRPLRAGTTTKWYVVEKNGDVAPFADYNNNPSFEYTSLRANGDRITIRFEACYEGACANGEVTATFNIPNPTPTPTPKPTPTPTPSPTPTPPPTIL